LAGAHHGDARGQLSYDRQAVGYENVGERELALEFLEQEQHLSADGNIKRGDRFVRNDEFRLKDQSARNADALAPTIVNLQVPWQLPRQTEWTGR